MTNLTLEICCCGVIGMLLRTCIVFCVHLELMRTGSTFSSTVCSVSECGHIFKLIGPEAMTCSRYSPRPKETLESLFSWRLLSMPVGIFGSKGIGKFSSRRGLLLLVGRINFFMMFLYLGIE